MAESSEVFPPAFDLGDNARLGISTRYGVTLKPSEDLMELITSFVKPEHLRRKVGLHAIRVGISDHQVEVNQADRKSAPIKAKINSYKRATDKYEKGITFKILREGFRFRQELSHNASSTGLSFDIATNSIMRGDIIRPPFFDDDVDPDKILRASIVFPTELIIDNAIKQAEVVEDALQSRHPTAQNELASYVFFFSNLQITGREIRHPPNLRVVRPGDET